LANVSHSPCINHSLQQRDFTSYIFITNWQWHFNQLSNQTGDLSFLSLSLRAYQPSKRDN